MKVGVPKETADGEHRVALVPDEVRRLAKQGVAVAIESGAGAGAHLSDDLFADAGAEVAGDGAVWEAEVVLKVRAPAGDELGRLRRGGMLIGFLAPLSDPDTARALAEAGVTSFAVEAVPRISRAQAMDALSSQSSVAGYRAALIAAQELRRFFPMLTTAAGTVKPARVLVLGAGVAGLQAIATAKRLGAAVSAFDVRTEVREQIESLGAKFLRLDFEADAQGQGGYARALSEEEQQRQQQALAEAITDFDAVITTALVPGRRAPVLVPAGAVRGMRAGSVIVDLAGEAGGNCELTEPGRTVEREGITIAAPLNLPSSLAEHASQLYARNLTSLLDLFVDDEGNLAPDFEDEILAGACITRDGEIVHEGARRAAGQEAPPRAGVEASGQEGAGGGTPGDPVAGGDRDDAPGGERPDDVSPGGQAAARPGTS